MMIVFSWFSLLNYTCRGHRPIVDTCANEAIPQWGKRRLITSVYLHQFSFPSMATGQAQNRHVDLFSTSFLHCCHNLPILRFLWLKKLHLNLPRSKDVESLLRTEIRAESTNFPGSFLRDCFVHVRCIPQQNLHCCFWASVSFLLFTSSWQEPFGESLSRLTIDSKNDVWVYTFELVIRLSKVNCWPSFGFHPVDRQVLNNWPLYVASPFPETPGFVAWSHDNLRSVLSRDSPQPFDMNR